jgi:predicted DNA-binding transcriptional regulator AlpA
MLFFILETNVNILLMTNKLLANLIRHIADDIEQDKCGLSPKELEDIANTITHVEYNIEQTCTYLNISRRTLARLQTKSTFPKSHKDSGGKLYWYRDELDTYILND